MVILLLQCYHIENNMFKCAVRNSSHRAYLAFINRKRFMSDYNRITEAIVDREEADRKIDKHEEFLQEQERIQQKHEEFLKQQRTKPNEFSKNTYEESYIIISGGIRINQIPSMRS
jgi:hypothetical protein